MTKKNNKKLIVVLIAIIIGLILAIISLIAMFGKLPDNISLLAIPGYILIIYGLFASRTLNKIPSDKVLEILYKEKIIFKKNPAYVFDQSGSITATARYVVSLTENFFQLVVFNQKKPKVINLNYKDIKNLSFSSSKKHTILNFEVGKKDSFQMEINKNSKELENDLLFMNFYRKLVRKIQVI